MLLALKLLFNQTYNKRITSLPIVKYCTQVLRLRGDRTRSAVFSCVDVIFRAL